MTALATERAPALYKASNIELLATAETVYRGGIACIDRSTGLVCKAKVDTDVIPIGTFTESLTVASGGSVVVKLFREIVGIWMVNATAGDAIAQANVGSLAFVLDDQTVASNDATNTRSVFGLIWKVDATKGVLVEPVLAPVGHITALDF